MSHSEEKCLRCDDAVLRLLPESSEEIKFYRCPTCGWNYVKGQGESLHDRWLSPISLVLYLVTSTKDPRERIDQIAALFIEQRDRDELSTLVYEIDRELREPTQRVTEILPFAHSPSEEIVREFLRGVSIRLKNHLRKPQEKKPLRTLQEFDGPCSVCGKPGYVRQIPGVSASACFCRDHVPSGTFRPIHIFIVLALLVGLGWLMYTLFLSR
jgi:DNA-directed RNA polymerase subunit RPC12/RpoP